MTPNSGSDVTVLFEGEYLKSAVRFGDNVTIGR